MRTRGSIKEHITEWKLTKSSEVGVLIKVCSVLRGKQGEQPIRLVLSGFIPSKDFS